jgi:hypothetical protein
MENLIKLIKEIEKDHNKVLCFYGFNDGYKRAERLYICYESNINLYSKLIHYEPLLGKMVRRGDTTWEELERALKENKGNYIEKLNTVRLIHGEYPACGFDTDHGTQVCGFDSLEDLMWDITSLDRGKIGHCLLANPQHELFDNHKILTKEQMFKDAIKFGQDKKEWKFLFEWEDNVEEKCNAYIPTPPKIVKPKDQRYRDLKELKWHLEELLKLDPGNEYRSKLPKIEEELKEYEE